MEQVNIVQLLHRSQLNLAWFGSHFAELIKSFDNQFVAIDDEKIIANDSDFDVLLNKLKGANIDPADVLIEFVSRIKSIL